MFPALALLAAITDNPRLRGYAVIVTIAAAALIAIFAASMSSSPFYEWTSNCVSGLMAIILTCLLLYVGMDGIPDFFDELAHHSNSSPEATIVPQNTPSPFCWVEPETGLSSITVYDEPHDQAHTKQFLFSGNRVIAIARKGERINIDMWWEIETSQVNNQGHYPTGWVMSSVVAESSAVDCLNLPRK